MVPRDEYGLNLTYRYIAPASSLATKQATDKQAQPGQDGDLSAQDGGRALGRAGFFGGICDVIGAACLGLSQHVQLATHQAFQDRLLQGGLQRL